uniref:hypothetical protein n=1 Tax=Flavobacterium sp. TaxID=239 RepID=UPI0040492E46
MPEESRDEELTRKQIIDIVNEEEKPLDFAFGCAFAFGCGCAFGCAFAFAFGCVFDGRPGGPSGSWVDSG